MGENNKKIKCLVWDLDNTFWNGTLLESDRLDVVDAAVRTLKQLDERGILHSIASKNDPKAALEQLESFGFTDFFLYPQINWGAKSASIKAIAESLNIGLDSIAFIDDQSFELDEVQHVHSEIRCFSASDVAELPSDPAFNPVSITPDAKLRRLMYLTDQKRQEDEERFDGPSSEFLETLEMRFELSIATESDLLRAEELTLRTHQLNTTGVTYSYDELDAIRKDPNHHLIVARLIDRYGDYGIIGLALVSCKTDSWTLKLLLMSCRVMSKGVGGTFLTFLRSAARKHQVRLRADWNPTDRNRMMYVTFRFAGFKEGTSHADEGVLVNDASEPPPYAQYMKVTEPAEL